MKKIILFLSILIAILTGCKKSDTAATSFAPQEPGKVTGIIGVSKIIAHPALDAIEKGLQDELTALGYTNLTYDLQSANGEISTAASIANKFRSEKVKVAVGIATPMALSLANNLKDTPVVFSAVTDPIDAGLRKSNGPEDSLIAGVSDMTPVEEQVKLIMKLVPVKTLGHIYNAGEANSIVLLKKLETICKEQGLTLIAMTVTNTSEVKQATEVLAQKGVDAIYVSTDNVVAAAINSVTTTALRYNIPVIGADPVTSANSSALAAYGVDYYEAGRQTGKIIAEILQGKKPGEIPVKYMTAPSELELYIDSNVAVKMGIKLPEEYNK